MYIPLTVKTKVVPIIRRNPRESGDNQLTIMEELPWLRPFVRLKLPLLASSQHAHHPVPVTEQVGHKRVLMKYGYSPNVTSTAHGKLAQSLHGVNHNELYTLFGLRAAPDNHNNVFCFEVALANHSRLGNIRWLEPRSET